MATVKELLAQMQGDFGLPQHEALWLAGHFLCQSKSSLLQNPGQTPPKELQQALLAAAKRRAEAEPLQYITGLQPFWDFELIVSPAVLIPRWDSETVIAQALKLIPKDAPQKIADVCTGSGAYALALKKERPQCTVHAADISKDALQIARRNAAKYNLAVEFFQGDLLTALPDKDYDLIVANPPYVKNDEVLPADVRQEPAAALFAGPDGLDFYRRLAQETAPYLKAGGLLLLEIGSEQASAVCALLSAAGFVGCRFGQDLAGLDRWVQAQKPI